MSGFVLDASITIGWMLERPVPARASMARKLIIAGEVPVVPVLWRHEVSTAVVISERRGRLTAAQVKTLTADLEEFSDRVEVDPLNVRVSVLIETARRTNLTVTTLPIWSWPPGAGCPWQRSTTSYVKQHGGPGWV